MAQDILYENANDESIVLQLSEEDNIFDVKIQYRVDFDMLRVECVGDYRKLSLFREHFEYLNAERKAPQVIYPKSSSHVDFRAQLGINGEYTVHYLSKYQDVDVEFYSERKYLKEAVQFWLNEISPNVKFDVSQIENTDLAMGGITSIKRKAGHSGPPMWDLEFLMYCR